MPFDLIEAVIVTRSAVLFTTKLIFCRFLVALFEVALSASVVYFLALSKVFNYTEHLRVFTNMKHYNP